jgi:hypothetical protein
MNANRDEGGARGIVRVINHRAQVPVDGRVVDTTSRSAELWSRGLSPFYLGPVGLYGAFAAENVENAWQYCKVYDQYVGLDGRPTAEYFTWATRGWNDPVARRYPMGRGARPLYSLWRVDGEDHHLGYIEARRMIYCPLYSSEVADTDAWTRLRAIYDEGRRTGTILYLRDFDGYDHVRAGMTYRDVVYNPNKKMGHAFVLAMMLEGDRAWI